MCEPATVIAAIGLVTSTGGTILQQRQARKSASAANRRAQEEAAARRRQEALEKRRQDIAATRDRRRAAAQARRFRAQAVNLAANRGAGGSIAAQGSTVPAVTGNILSQLNFNNAFVNRITDINSQITRAENDRLDIANRPINNTGFGTALSSFGNSLTSNAKTISKLF